MKKVFTLIELLAVIVILTIIAVIATSIITNIIEDVKTSSKEISIDNYAKALEISIYKYQLQNDNLTFGSFQTIDGKTLTNGDITKLSSRRSHLQ